MTSPPQATHTQAMLKQSELESEAELETDNVRGFVANASQPLPSPNVCVADQACSNGLYAAYRAELEHELHSMFGPDWRSENGLTPSQELAAWDKDGDRINRAAEVVAYRRRMAA